jgi:hypothetical protein
MAVENAMMVRLGQWYESVTTGTLDQFIALPHSLDHRAECDAPHANCSLGDAAEFGSLFVGQAIIRGVSLQLV